MQRRLLLIPLLAILMAPLAAEAAGPPKPKIAVLDLHAARKIDEALVGLLNELLLTEFSQAGFEVFGGSDLRALLQLEGQQQTFGCEEDSCLAEVGAALGVDLLVTSSVGAVGSKYLLNMKMLNTRQAQVEARVSKYIEGDEEALVGSIREAAAILVKAVRAKTGAEPKTTPPDESRPSATAPGPRQNEPQDTPQVSAVSAPAAGEKAAVSSGGPPAWLPWVVIGVGVAAAGTGGAFGFLAQDSAKQRDSAASYEQYQSLDGQARGMALGTNVLFIAGGAVAATGIVLFFWRILGSSDAPPATAGSDITVQLDPINRGASASFRF